MKKYAHLMVAAILSIGLVGCGKKDTPESLADEGVAALDKFVTELEGITDAESAKAALPKLEEVSKTMEDLEARADKLGEGAQEQIEAASKEKAEKLIERMMGAILKLATNEEVMKIIGPAIDDMK